jgi:hypothetical protein
MDRPATNLRSVPANPDFLLARQASFRWTSSPLTKEVRPGIEPGLPPYRGGVPPEHLQTNCQNDPGWNRTIVLLVVTQASWPLDHGIGLLLQVAEMGVEPTKSRGSRPRRFSCLRTRPCGAPLSGAKLQVRVSHPAG